MPSDLILPEAARIKLAALGSRYLWWDRAPRSTIRLVAQIMNLGTYEHILLIERLLSRDMLVAVMADAEPGWFSERSWDFWRGRLRADVPDHPPGRVFARAS